MNLPFFNWIFFLTLFYDLGASQLQSSCLQNKSIHRVMTHPEIIQVSNQLSSTWPLMLCLISLKCQKWEDWHSKFKNCWSKSQVARKCVELWMLILGIKYISNLSWCVKENVGKVRLNVKKHEQIKSSLSELISVWQRWGLYNPSGHVWISVLCILTITFAS